MKKTIILLSIGIALFACGKAKEEVKIKDKNILINKEASLINSNDPGYVLMKNNCYVCHNPNTKSHDEVIAPPFAAVKRRYSMQYKNKDVFVNAVVNWVLDPNEDKALMRGAVNQYKVMPKLVLEKNKLEKIANYLYDNDIEQPVWFEDHFNDMHGKRGKMNNQNKK